MSDCTALDRVRQPKLFDMSIFDWVASLSGAVLLGWMIQVKGISWIGFLLAWILFGVVVHSAFGVKTMLGYYLGLNEKPIRKTC